MTSPRPTTGRRVAAAAALVFAVAAILASATLAAAVFPRGMLAAAGLFLAIGAASYGAVRPGLRRFVAFGGAAALVVGSMILLLSDEPVLVGLAAGGLLLSIACAHRAFRPHAVLPAAAPPAHPVLFYNPKSGGGKAERFHLADEAQARGFQTVALTPGDDLRDLVREAIAGGADALAMAGGDGSQAVVAEMAAAHGLPYACIPAGTRNHFALDLGVDRDDVVGALEAFVDGGERFVDLAEVNGRVFVNNVSLGLYAEAVQRTGYREAKIRTILDTASGGAEAGGVPLHYAGPEGSEDPGGLALMVSNDCYRLGRAIGSGTRPRLDDGMLGVTVLNVPGPGVGHAWRAWAAPTFEVRADEPVPAGIDGEAVRLDPPLRFRTRPAALRVRIARAHPGASPSSLIPENPAGVPGALLAIAAGRWSEPHRAGGAGTLAAS